MIFNGKMCNENQMFDGNFYSFFIVGMKIVMGKRNEKDIRCLIKSDIAADFT